MDNLLFFRRVPMPAVALLAVQNCMYSSIAGPLDCLSVASSLGRTAGEWTEPRFRVSIVGPPGRTVTAFNGTTIPAEAYFNDDLVYDIVFVPVIFGELEPLLADRETIDWLARQGERGACLASVCAGAFLLAQTGRLNGRKATTHWNLADSFARRFPQVILKREKMLVDEGDCITAGGVSAYLDLTLYLVDRFGSHELAATLSKLLLIDPSRRLQSPYRTGIFPKTHGDAAILGVQEWLEEHFQERVALAELAARARLGERTFMRRFRKATGESPLHYVQELRLEVARKLLETTSKPIEDVTRLAGYEDVSSFRKLFKRSTGLTPSAYRRKFSCIY